MPQLVVGAAILDAHPTNRPRAVLCAQRAAPAHLAGRWELPGGKVEPGETPDAALRREIREELAADIDLHGALPGPVDGDWPIPGGRLLRVRLASLTSGPVARHGPDHLALHWATVDDVLALDWLDADLPIARDLHALLRGD